MASSHRALPPLDLLRGFEAAARHLSFTRAAVELFLTQSAVSRQIQALESFLGAPLFERRHKALALTAAGQAYYRAVAPVLDQLREATRRARQPLLNPADLRHHVLLNLHDPTGRWPWLSWAAWLEAMGVEELTPAGTVTLDQYDQVLQAALHGQGVALGRLTLSAQHIRAKRLVALFGRQQRLARAFHAVYSSGARDRPEARQFVDWLQQEIKREG